MRFFLPIDAPEGDDFYKSEDAGGLLDVVELPPMLGMLLWMAQGGADVVAKGAGHKYLKRIPTGNPKRPWKYIYRVGQGGALHAEEHMQVGAAFKVANAGKEGHFHVVAADGDHVTIRHDESGHEERVSRKALAAMIHSEHAEAIGAHREKLGRDIATARKKGSAKQASRLEAEARRNEYHEHLAHAAAHDETTGYKEPDGWTMGKKAIPPRHVLGDHLDEETRDWSAQDHHDAAAGLRNRHMIAEVTGSGVDLDTLTSTGAQHPVFGGDGEVISAPDGTKYRRGMKVSYGQDKGRQQWIAVGDNPVGARGHTRADLERKHGAEGWGEANESKGEAHDRVVTKMKNSLWGAGAEDVGRALHQHVTADAQGKASGQIADDKHGPISMAHAADLMDAHERNANRTRSRFDNKPVAWAPRLTDDQLDRIVTARGNPGLSDSFHRELAARWGKGLAHGDHGDHGVTKVGSDWHVTKGEGERRTSVNAKTKGEALHAAGMMARGDSEAEANAAVISGQAKRALELHAHAKEIAKLGETAASLDGMAQVAAPKPGAFAVKPKAHATRESAARRLSGFASKDHLNRDNLGHYKVEGGMATATDGYRLARVPVAGDHREGGTYRAFKHPMLANRDAGSEGRVDFPHYQAVTKDTQHQDDIDAGHMKRVVGAIQAHAGPGASLTIHRRGGKVFASHISSDPKYADGGAPMIPLGATSAPDSDVAVNARYLADAVSGAKGTVRLGIDQPRKNHYEVPVTVHREDGEKHWVMPLNPSALKGGLAALHRRG